MNVISTFLSSAAAFVSTELDEFVLLLILFASCSTKKHKVFASIGKYFALALVTVGSAFFASYLTKIPGKYIGLLGLVPIGIGIKEIFEKKSSAESNELGEKSENFGRNLAVFATAVLISLGSSGDNFAVYIPFFTSLKSWDFLICGIVFFVFQLAMLILASLAIQIPVIQKIIKKIGHILIPVLLIALGIFILLKNGTVSWIISIFAK